MEDLVPVPFGRLVTRMFRELERDQAIFDLEASKFVRGDAARDLSVSLHGKTAATPLGPAAGPHTQLAQNIVLAFLGGGRIFELKTVQILDTLKIPRPCIDLRTVGYNVEWSQELTLDKSLEEYVKASMLIDMLVASGKIGLAPGFEKVIFDMSVGYDLAGIRSDRVNAFLRGLMDATPVVDRLRAEIPAEWAAYRDLDFRTRLSSSLTLSTFHGCPPEEIERIAEHLLDDVGLHTVVKLNPTLLGKDETRRLFHDVLGYRQRIPDEAFDKDAHWDQATAFVHRLADRAKTRGLGFGVKLTNTLVVENPGDFFPATEKLMYLSGPPLHVLAMALVGRFRATFGDRFPISFSAGIDKGNFADAVALGLVPVTVCTDLLRPGGYGRMRHYFTDLGKRMAAVNAKTIDELVLRTSGKPTLAEARVANTAAYVDRLLTDPRYRREANEKPPTKVGTRLWLFDCLTCDKCIPVCPNDANFAFTLPKTEIPVVKLRLRDDGSFERDEAAPLRIEKKHQIGNFSDACNECGNCDIFCPEDGGPYVLKPRFFGSEERFVGSPDRDGFFVSRSGTRDRVLGRFDKRAFAIDVEGEMASFAGAGFDVRLSVVDPEAQIQGKCNPGVEIDLTYFRIMDWLRRAILDGPGVNFLNAV